MALRKVNRNPNLIKGARLAPPVSSAARYNGELRKLIRKMTEETKRTMKSLLEQSGMDSVDTFDAPTIDKTMATLNKLTKKFTTMFDDEAGEISLKFVTGVGNYGNKSAGSSIKKMIKDVTIKTTELPQDVRDTMAKAVEENSLLISSIPQEHMDKIRERLIDDVTMGRSSGDIFDSISEVDGMTYRRAKIIADDQTRKVYNSVANARMQSAGVTKGEWIHSFGGREPRETHIDMDGQIFDLNQGLFDDDPEVQEYVLPGQLVNCRCTFAPVFDDVGDED